MAMRVTEGMKFGTSLYNLNALQVSYKKILDAMSSQKEINRPSDNPTGMGQLLAIRHMQQLGTQYRKNIESSDSWLKMTESKLSDLNDLLVNARELAIAQATGTASAQTRLAAAASVQQLTEQMFNIANSQYLDRYIFAGARADQAPFSRASFLGEQTNLRQSVQAGADNTYSGTAASLVRVIKLAKVAVGDKVTIDGVEYSAIEATAVPAAGQFNIGATDAATADNLRAAIAAASPGVYELGGAGTASITIAKRHQVSSQGWPDTDTTGVGDSGGDLVIQVGSSFITIDDADLNAATTLEELRDLINNDAENAGRLTASIVDDGAGPAPFRLVLTAAGGGSEKAVSIANNPTNLAFSSLNTAEVDSLSTNNRAHFSSTAAATNSTYVVKITTGGTLATAEFAVSKDGGRTWGAVRTDLDSGVVDLGEGIVLKFTAGLFAEGDIFTARATVAGHYDGDGQEASTDIGEGAPFAYAVSGEAVFTDKGSGRVDVFEVMKDLKTALEKNDQQGIQAQIDKLKEASDQVILATTTVGARMKRMEVAKGFHDSNDLRLADLVSKIEDADITKLAMDLATTKLALQASYEVASMIADKTSILYFLK